MHYIQEIKQILSQVRQETYQAINIAMIQAYWDIGKKNIEDEQEGKEIVKTFSVALSNEFSKVFRKGRLEILDIFIYHFQKY